MLCDEWTTKRGTIKRRAKTVGGERCGKGGKEIREKIGNTITYVKRKKIKEGV
jgi:hypothetical protein